VSVTNKNYLQFQVEFKIDYAFITNLVRLLHQTKKAPMFRKNKNVVTVYSNMTIDQFCTPYLLYEIITCCCQTPNNIS